MQVDTIVENARVLTQDEACPRATGIAVLGGRIVAVETESSGRNAAPGRSGTLEGLTARRRIDAEGAVVVPGFNDAHAHSVWFGHTLLETDLSSCDGLTDLYDRIARASSELEPGEWLVASGYNQMDTGGAYPDADRLDAAAGGRPVWIKHTSGHSCFVSRRAIEMLGITGREQFDGGSVVCDRDGQPTGLLEETAMALVQQKMLPAPQQQIVAALDAATERYAAEGLTSVTDAGIGGGWIGHSSQEFAAYQAALEAGVLRTRMQPMLVADVLTDVALSEDGRTFRGLPGGLRSGLGDDRLQLGPVKIFLDGSILGNTARMSEGYHNCPSNHGYFQGDRDEMRRQALEAGRAGWALAMHAVGDEAVGLAIEILEQLRAEGVTPPLPHRIEHGGVVSETQLAALASLGTSIVAQPYFMRVYGDGFRGYIGDDRAAQSFRLGSLLRHGVPVAGSSDRPVASGRPLDVMQAAVERLTADAWVYGPDERLTAAEALRAYTAGSAEVTGWGAQKGLLAPGYLADFTVLGGDPTEVEPSRIGSIEVLATAVGGEATFDARGMLGARSDAV